MCKVDRVRVRGNKRGTGVTHKPERAKVLLGALSLFGICILLAVVASNMISNQDPNAPVALVYVEPIPTTPATGKQLRGPIELDHTSRAVDESLEIEVDVLGSSVSRQTPMRGDQIWAGDGDLLGDWVVTEEDLVGRYLIVQDRHQVQLITVTYGGETTEQPLVEIPTASGRRFRYPNDDRSYLTIRDDASLSFGNATGIELTVKPTRPQVK